MDWYEGIIKPLYKVGNREICSNYRAITISSTLYKTVVRITSWGNTKESFRKAIDVKITSLHIMEFAPYGKTRKQMTYLAVLDIIKG